ncbi:phosphopantetheine-binding protein [Streptomyces sp. NPDC048717]|uniref:phosphopantetheine-binding protein n=1 Tax=Streptomyces sp. NPDC048717 TaxID=3154928 RepID=UPI003426A8BC
MSTTDIPATTERLATPATATAPTIAAIAAIWQEVLGVPVAENDDFFALGGQSLAAMEVVAALRRRLGVTIRVRVLLEHPVLADFAGQLAVPTA